MVDPMTMALIAKGVISAGKAIQGVQQRKEARQLEEETLSKGMPRLQTPAEYYQLYKSAQRDKAMEAEIAQAQQTQAANLEALQTAGSRALLGGSPAVVAATQANIADAARRGYQREQQALGQLAAAQARTQGMNFQADLAERNRRLQQAALGFQAGTETLYSGLEGVASSSILAADELGGGTKTLQASPKETDGKPVVSEPVVPESPFGTEVEGARTQEMIDFYDLSNPFPFSQKRKMTAQELVDYNVYQGAPMDRVITNPYSFGVTVRKDGGPITTKGNFDHNSNPLHVLNNNGDKVAEVTGQETLVYNPKQRQLMKKIMSRLINKGKVTLTDSEKKEAREVLKAFQQ